MHNYLYILTHACLCLAVTVGFSQEVYPVMEDDDLGNGLSVAVCLVFEGELERGVTVSVSTSDGSAIGEL